MSSRSAALLGVMSSTPFVPTPWGVPETTMGVQSDYTLGLYGDAGLPPPEPLVPLDVRPSLAVPSVYDASPAPELNWEHDLDERMFGDEETPLLEETRTGRRYNDAPDPPSETTPLIEEARAAPERHTLRPSDERTLTRRLPRFEKALRYLGFGTTLAEAAYTEYEYHHERIDGKERATEHGGQVGQLAGAEVGGVAAGMGALAAGSYFGAAAGATLGPIGAVLGATAGEFVAGAAVPIVGLVGGTLGWFTGRAVGQRLGGAAHKATFGGVKKTEYGVETVDRTGRAYGDQNVKHYFRPRRRFARSTNPAKTMFRYTLPHLPGETVSTTIPNIEAQLQPRSRRRRRHRRPETAADDEPESLNDETLNDRLAGLDAAFKASHSTDDIREDVHRAIKTLRSQHNHSEQTGDAHTANYLAGWIRRGHDLDRMLARNNGQVHALTKEQGNTLNVLLGLAAGPEPAPAPAPAATPAPAPSAYADDSEQLLSGDVDEAMVAHILELLDANEPLR